MKKKMEETSVEDANTFFENMEDKDEGEERVLLIQEKEGQEISSFMKEMEGGGKEEVRVKQVSVENYVEDKGRVLFTGESS